MDNHDAESGSLGSSIAKFTCHEIPMRTKRPLLPEASGGAVRRTFEAFQMGLPVIVTPLASIRELVTEGKGRAVRRGRVDGIDPGRHHAHHRG